MVSMIKDAKPDRRDGLNLTIDGLEFVIKAIPRTEQVICYGWFTRWTQIVTTGFDYVLCLKGMGNAKYD